MIFRKATTADIDSVEQSYVEYLEYEQIHGAWTVWKLGVYPTRQTAEESVEKGTLYVLEDEDEILASIILNHDQAKEYESVPWKCDASGDEVLVLHTLCVRPSAGGRGIGKKMVQYSIEEARRLGCKTMRLDTGAQNKPAVGLYVKMGFDVVSSGTILLDGQIPHEGHVFLEYQL